MAFMLQNDQECDLNLELKNAKGEVVGVDKVDSAAGIVWANTGEGVAADLIVAADGGSAVLRAVADADGAPGSITVDFDGDPGVGVRAFHLEGDYIVSAVGGAVTANLVFGTPRQKA